MSSIFFCINGGLHNYWQWCTKRTKIVILLCARNYTKILLYCYTAIECPSITLTNGMVAYAADNSPPFSLGTVATYTCSPGFALVGDMTRTCMDDDQADIVGVWSGVASSCEGNGTHDLCLFVTC